MFACVLFGELLLTTISAGCCCATGVIPAFLSSEKLEGERGKELIDGAAEAFNVKFLRFFLLSADLGGSTKVCF